MPTKVEDLKSDISELRKLLETATRPRVKDVLSIELRKMETSLASLKSIADEDAAPATKPASATKPIPSEKIRNYAWDQSDKFVKFYLTVPGVQELSADQISLNTTETSCALRISFPDKICTFGLDNLLNNIVSEDSYHKVKPDNVVIFLKKKVSEKWSFITKTEKKIKDARSADLAPKKESDDPSDGLMSIMKRLYQEGDDDMKRNIAKAWTQSREGGASSTMENMDFP